MKLRHLVPRALRPALSQAKMRVKRLTRHLPGRPDPVFDRFPAWRGESDGRWHLDFLGVRTDPRFHPTLRAAPPGAAAPGLPPLDDHYPEWVFLLRVVEACREQAEFVAADFGAGWGPWLVAAHAAMRRAAPGCRTRLLGVEADPAHFEFMERHFRDNGLDPAEHRLIRAALTPADGIVYFEAPENAAASYGHGIVREGHGAVPKIEVPAVSLATAAAGFSRLDYVTMDIQGAEGEVIPAALPVLNAKVRCFVVETHSRALDDVVGRTLAGAGWQNVFNFPFRRLVRSPWGWLWTEGGQQAWCNPALGPGLVLA